MPHLFIKTGSLKQATYRIRVLPWLKLVHYGYTIKTWNSYLHLIFLLIRSLLDNNQCFVLTNKSFSSLYILTTILFKPYNVIFAQDIADFNRYNKSTTFFSLISRLLRHLSILFSDVLFTPTFQLFPLNLDNF